MAAAFLHHALAAGAKPAVTGALIVLNDTTRPFLAANGLPGHPPVGPRSLPALRASGTARFASVVLMGGSPLAEFDGSAMFIRAFTS
jgi:hypothetical protein